MKITYFLTIVLASAVAKSDHREREKRYLVAFPTNSATGILVAISVPLILPQRNVFVSYNFEANYNMPTTAADVIPGPLKRLDLIDRRKRHDRESLLTRKKIYRVLERRFKRSCLLKAICQEAREPINDHNGLHGDILHIILTPSTSVTEDLHPEYYKAEELGRSGDCAKYRKYCPKSIIENYLIN
ncbi:uncharacterized protein LOC132265261 [Phlebotomus argentipes]|uniref:uncharacterized protein LOC132265261 n=1 Tax=Phlebotomus argentipes TaxID=94469 RepID=UPI0028936D83|nr:uncharacterized protein LOC132265261 [Phlebotomus argentipes]